ncbi:MAG: hypothetical protein M3357_19250, partial [Actinomycetota bacterium]|nr:hypothetical protein [Actinomycetota bacterium]
MFRVGGGAAGRRRVSHSHLLLGLPVTLGAAAFLSALSAGSGTQATPASSVAAVQAPAPAAPSASDAI